MKKDIIKIAEEIFKSDKFFIDKNFEMKKTHITISPNVSVSCEADKVILKDTFKELFFVKKNKLIFTRNPIKRLFMFLTILKIKKLLQELKSDGFKQEFNNKENSAIFLR